MSKPFVLMRTPDKTSGNVRVRYSALGGPIEIRVFGQSGDAPISLSTLRELLDLLGNEAGCPVRLVDQKTGKILETLGDDE